MSAQALVVTARTLIAGHKGLLAMNESNPTCNKRFGRLDLPQIEEAWRAWRELIVTTPGLNESISGVILYDESIRQQKKYDTLFVKFHTDAGKPSPPVADKEEDETLVRLANRGLPLINLLTAAAQADSNVMWK